MAHSVQHQRRKAAKAARRKAIVAEKQKLELSTVSLAGKVRAAAKGPVVRCLMPSHLFKAGVGMIIIARGLPSGLLGCGFFLVDAFCLGVKDAFYREIGEDDLQSRLDAQADVQGHVDAAPACARKLVRDAVAYAADLGLAAAKDYRAIEAIFGDVDADECAETFTFGKDGKPFFVAGPFDTPARIRIVTRTLQARCGDKGWDYLIELPTDSDDRSDIELADATPPMIEADE